MPDLGKTDAEWKRFLGEELGGCVLAVIRDAWELDRKLRLEREQVVVIDSRATFHGAVVLEGVRLGVNTHVTGKLFARLTNNGGGPNKDVKLFKATGGGGGDEVARATAVVPGASGALVAQNGSGLSGSWPLPDPSAESTDDTVVLFPVVDYPLRAKRALDGTQEKDTQGALFLAERYQAFSVRLRDALNRFVAEVSTYFTNIALRGAAFTGGSESSMATESNTQDNSGNRSTSATGFLPSTKLSMQEETEGSEQDVLERVVTLNEGVFAAANVGLFRTRIAAAPGAQEHAPIGVLNWKCSLGADDGAIGREQFMARLKIDGEDREIELGPAQVGRSSAFRPGVGPFTIERIYTKTGDDAHENLADVDDGAGNNLVSVSGENNLNTDEGQLYGLVEETDTGIFSYTFWASATARAQRIAAQIVAKAVGVVADADFVATGYNNFPDFEIAWTAGSAPVDATEFELHLNPARRDRGDGQPDQFTMALVLTSQGVFQRLLADFFGYHLNSDNSGSETIGDGYATAGTFPPRAVLDV